MATADAGHAGRVGASGHTADELRSESFGELLTGLASYVSLLVELVTLLDAFLGLWLAALIVLVLWGIAASA